MFFCMIWGVRTLPTLWGPNCVQRCQLCDHFCVKKGDFVIITKGDLMGTSGGTNALKIVEVGNLIEV